MSSLVFHIDFRTDWDGKKRLIIFGENSLSAACIEISDEEYARLSKMHEVERQKTVRKNPEYYGLKKGDKIH